MDEVPYEKLDQDLPEPQPVFLEPLDKAFPKKVTKRAAGDRANQDRIAGEQRWLGKDKHAGAKPDPPPIIAPLTTPETMLAKWFSSCGMAIGALASE